MNKDFFKLRIANYFISDSFEFLNRFDILSNSNITQQLSVGKLAVELLFAFECSIKAQIFIESTSNIEGTYKSIKTHNLGTLIKLLTPKNQKKVKSLFPNENFKNWEVGIRYLMEAEAYMSNTYMAEHKNNKNAENFKYGIFELEKFDSINKLNLIKVKTREWLRYVVECYNKCEGIEKFQSYDINEKLTQISFEKEELKKLTGKKK